ncbi:MAG: alkaline phosphatase, partial [Armatimonadetes bacterium]|nr:alkaline phosphatase [Armatimonadota bacterium]
APAGETLQAGRKRGAVKEPFADPLLPTVPSLATLSRAALNVLDDDPDGLFLMIEGGAVDWAAHSNYGWRVIEEIIDFEDAIAAVVEWVEANSSWDETLLVITSDHETGGLTGPGEGWPDLVAAGQGKQPEMVFRTGGHTNSLVPFFARGAGSERYLTLATKVDPRRGCYLDNTDVAQTIFALWK